jgi:hypothetical protein
VKAYDKWGATLLFLMGPLGLIVNMIMALKNNWDSIVQAFTSDGILGGLKRIGVVLIDAVLYPIQQLLGLLSNIPGMGKLAGRGEAYLATLRKNLNLATPQSATSTVSNETGDAASADATSTGKNKSTTSAVASGGSRSTQISIHLGKMVENIVFQGGVKENARDMEAQVEEILLRVLFAAQSAG